MQKVSECSDAAPTAQAGVEDDLKNPPRLHYRYNTTYQCMLKKHIMSSDNVCLLVNVIFISSSQSRNDRCLPFSHDEGIVSKYVT